MKITVEQIMKLGPCQSDWTEEAVRKHVPEGGGTIEQLYEWLMAEKAVHASDKRWLLSRLLGDGCVEWAIRCAEAVLPIWEARYPEDDRPRRAIAAARGGTANAVTSDAAADTYAAAAVAVAVDDAAYAAAAAAAYAADAAYAAAAAAAYAADAVNNAAAAAAHATYASSRAGSVYALGCDILREMERAGVK